MKMKRQLVTPFVSLAAFFVFCGGITGCSNTTASNDTTHQEAKKRVQQNQQQMLNSASVTPEEKTRMQEGMQRGQEAIQRNNAQSHMPHVTAKAP